MNNGLSLKIFLSAKRLLLAAFGAIFYRKCKKVGKSG
jgi:hypothetical protein